MKAVLISVLAAFSLTGCIATIGVTVPLTPIYVQPRHVYVVPHAPVYVQPAPIYVVPRHHHGHRHHR